MSKASSALLMDAIGGWIKSIDDYPGWRDFQRKKISTVMNIAEGFPAPPDFPDFIFDPEVERQHAAVMSYMSLVVSLHSLQECEHYFRRYPFQALPVTKEAHLRNICEMYFNRFYEFRERLKRCLNAVNATLDGGQLNVGQVLKAFSKDFDQELRARNSIHHHDRFDDAAISAIGMASLMAASEEVGAGRQMVVRRSYRSTSAEWAKRVKRRSARVEMYVEAVAEAMLARARFLTAAQDKAAR